MPRRGHIRRIRAVILIPPARPIPPLITAMPTAGRRLTGRQSVSAGAGLTPIRMGAFPPLTHHIRFSPRAADTGAPWPRIQMVRGVQAVQVGGRQAGRVSRG